MQHLGKKTSLLHSIQNNAYFSIIIHHDINRNQMSFREKYQQIPQWARIGLWIIASLFILVLLLWGGLAWYVNNNKSALKARIESEIGNHLDGTLTLEDIEPALLRSFPNISVRVKGLLLTDSLYAQHQRPTIRLGSLYVKFDLVSLIKGKPTIQNVRLADGTIHLFTDTNGYTNLYLFEKKKKEKPSKKRKLAIDNFDLENVLFIFDHHQRDKQFKISLKHIHGKITEQGQVTRFRIRTDALVHQLGFRLSKGGFMINKTVKGTVDLIYNKNNKILEIPERKLQVQGTPVFYSALFYTAEKPVAFKMLIKAPRIDYQEGISMLSQHINSKLKKIKVSDPIHVQTHIDGHFKYPDTPIVKVYFETKNNIVTTSYGKLNKATFSGTFTNYYRPGEGFADNNSLTSIPVLKANWEGIPFEVDSIRILTTLHPLLSCHIKADFPVEQLNNITGNTFKMKKGRTSIDLRYKGPIAAGDNYAYLMTGSIRLKDVTLSYLPRGLDFNKCNASIEFTGKDMYLKHTTLSTNKSTIQLDGVATDFMKIYFTDPGKVVFNWNLKSELIDLNEFRSFLGQRKKLVVSSAQKNRRVVQFNKQLDDMLEQSSMYLKINIGHVTYRKFDATAIQANLALKKEGIELNKVMLRHAGGSLSADLHIKQSRSGNPFSIQAQVQQVEVDKLFEAFENFGQNSITAQNLEGSFTATVDVHGSLEESGNLVQNSLGGRVDFKLTNGALKQFKPLLQVQKFVFKKRNLDHITFKTLEDRLDIDRGKIKIYPMDIQSSAINMRVQGVYALGAGTDIAMEVPLRDPQKDKERAEQGLPPRKNKGIILYLRATDGADGKVKIGWDPFKKGQRNTIDEEEEHAD